MTPAEAARLLALAAAFDRRTVGEADALAWASTLDGFSYDDCVQAVKNHYGTTTDWLMPAHVKTEVRRIRSDRISRDPEAVPDADPDDIAAYLAALREGRFRAADGSEKPRPVAQLISGGHGLPRDVR